MFKVIILSLVLVLVFLAVNSYWPFLRELQLNFPNREGMMESLKEAPRSLPQMASDKARGVVKGVQSDAVSYLLKKTGQEIVEILETLPPEQQEEIKKEYCGQDPKPTP